MYHSIAVLLLLIASAIIPTGRDVQQDQRCFPETGRCISGVIRSYWEENGGLPVFGYPITDLTTETNTEGFAGRLQWFERDRLEDHSAEGKGVLAGRLGAQKLVIEDRPWEGLAKGQPGAADCRFFSETGHSLCPPFHSYWEHNGGLARFGYPISEPQTETNAAGFTGIVQWFERRRMELHPENTVMLGLLGTEMRSTSSPSPVFVGAGDIAGCTTDGDEATAKLLDALEGTVYTLGDNVYDNGTDAEFRNCYEPSWGRHKARTRPSPGNKEYAMPEASGYYSDFGAAAGDAQKGYYSYDLGSWHIIVLNSNCAAVGGCGADSAQERWLRADLATHSVPCTLAYWHHPLFSSAHNGSTSSMRPFWEVLYEAGADVVLNGHHHHYERFAPQEPDGTLDRHQGIREFVVGTGGAGLSPLGPQVANSELRDNNTFGVLKLTLHSGHYEWEFVPVAGKSFTDKGEAACH